MKPISSVKGKTTMPQLPEGFILSEELSKLVNSLRNKRIVQITAPSGYGKTTFMIYAISALSSEKDRICWYRLDEGDTDLASFYSNLTETLFPEDDQRWSSVRTALSEFEDHQTQYRTINSLICRELWNTFGKVRNTKVFVAFDNCQFVVGSKEITETIAYLVDNAPRNFTVFLTGRERNDFLNMRYILDSGCVEIVQKDLCFTENDIRALAGNTYHFNPSPNLVKKIYDRTGGWKAGVILFCQYLTAITPEQAEAFLNGPMQGTSVFSYILYEVLMKIDQDLLIFLIKIASLHDFTEDAVREILDEIRAGEIIRECERKGMFIDRTAGESITFSFHNLFREALINLQKTYLTEEELKDLSRRAAAYYQKRKMYRRATEHFILSGDIGFAVEMIIHESLEFTILEATSELRALLSMIPDNVIEQYGQMLFIKSGIYIQDRSRKPEVLLVKALHKFEESGDLPMQLNSLLGLVNLSMLATYSNIAAFYTAKALKVLRKMGKTEEMDTLRKLCLFMAAVCTEKFHRAREISSYLKDNHMPHEWAWQFLMVSCDLYSALGDYEMAENLVRKALSQYLSQKTNSYRGTALSLLSRILCFRDDTESSYAIDSELKQLGQTFGFYYFLGVAGRSDAYRKYSRNDVSGAAEAMTASARNFEMQENPALALIDRLCVLLWMPAETSPEKRYLSARALHTQYDSLFPGFCMKEVCSSLYGAVARECGYFVDAEDVLLSAAASSEAKGGKHVLCGILFHLAKLFIDRRDFVQADETLKKAMKLGWENKYIIFWDLHLETMACVLLYCVKKWIYAQYAMELLDRYFGSSIAALAVRELRLANLDEFSAFSKDFYLQISGPAKQMKFKITLLGEFRLTCNGNDIPHSVWKTKKVKWILQYLALHYGYPVSREQLMDLFWPSSDRKKASESLSTALYELKKVFRHFAGIDGTAEIIQDKSGGLVLSPSLDWTIDTEKLTQLYNYYVKLKKDGYVKASFKSLLSQITELCSGSLLADDPYCEWALSAREEFGLIFTEAVRSIHPLMLEDKEYSELEALLQKALGIDPFNEDIAYDLIELLTVSGKRSHALKFYSDFRSTLKTELGIEPQERLRGVISSSSKA